MSNDFEPCLAFTLREEGGFCDLPSDPGGATNYGITLATLRHWSNNAALGTDAIRAISITTVHAIYQADFWNRMDCAALPNGVDLMLFDHGVNAGPQPSIRILQHAARLADNDIDGCIGPQTIAAAAAAAADRSALLGRMATLQTGYYRSLEGFAEFGSGWLARVERRLAAAISMAAMPVSS